ncbi:DUF742 domain-containing protein [Streptomyces armeniacus]|uniref:DUF742 domain-containing protein n=1 Tax=Streptomyces armeniacus TaxID=83291 RepID=A0A345XYY0_9ACTN|nr:DUF742 domain-containing protein [Streptomyces armeniacus]AXK36846.1 DUF742 domain-containing protein [Streptomyces armeniacus]
MTTPPGGPSYGSGRDQQQSQGAPLKRYNFPSAPSDHVRGQRQQQEPQPPQQSQGQRGQHASQQHYQPGQPQQPQHGQQPYSAPESAPQSRPHQPPPSPSRIQPVQPPRPRSEQSGADGRGEPQQLVRPYAMTGGRTRPRYQLAIEALVSTTAEFAQLQGQLPEHQRICRLCYEIKSVAEISALLSIPLGVARILVADLAEAGLVAIHQPGGDDSTADGQPDVTLLERVLSGLRKL